ncbi:unnamed protein product [Euphydryas editha]|uniref:Endonuclease/exonuclease/phosphatase domain-containing protein n=1 Tax=Euphydryas editha TaxID=104508 RepID=A0AAU9U6T0_EUPED|nr:unnamed protein product [Euphydryas editha]
MSYVIQDKQKAYAPAEKANEDEIQKFYEDLNEAHSLIDGRVLVTGDFNAKIGQQQKTDNNQIIGRFGFGKRNERGERLIEYATEHKLAVMNTFFKKKNHRKWTWISPDRKTVNEIDFILSNSPKSATNVEVISNVKFFSDHRLVRAAITVKPPKKSRKNFKNMNSTPKTIEETNSYLKKLTEFLETLDKLSTDVQTYYNQLENIILDSLKTQQLTEIKTHKILREETKLLINRRTELIKTKNKDKYMKNELSRLYKIYQSHKSIKKRLRQL